MIGHTDIEKIVRSPRLKVERAKHHIDSFRLATEPLFPDYYRLYYRKYVHDTGATAFVELVYEPVQPIPEALALIIGDTVHNLRAALDHLVTGILRIDNPSAEEHFPMRPEWEQFKTAPVIAAIEKALPGATKLLLEEVRPKGRSNDNLWAFNKLDNDDKHNLVLPAVAITKISGKNIRSAGLLIRQFDVSGDATSPLNIGRFPEPVSVEGGFYASVSVTFGDVRAFKGQPVIPTLTQIQQLVSEVIDKFERHMLTAAT